MTAASALGWLIAGILSSIAMVFAERKPTVKYPSLETCEVADAVRGLLRRHLREDARLFYGDEAVGFVKVTRRRWGWGLQIDVHEVGGTYVWADTDDELLRIFGVLLESGYAERLLQGVES